MGSRDKLQETLKVNVARVMAPRGIIVESILLNDVKLPANVVKSIEDKAKAEQQSERMKFVLMKARKEAERKGIEAEGIKQFQEIVSSGIDQKVLQWKGIEATESFTNSDSPKIVVIGN